MSDITFYAPDALSTKAGPGGRLYAAFLAGRSPHTLRAYAADLEALAAYLGEPSPGGGLSRLISVSAGEGNGLLLAFRAQMIDAGLTSATINRRLSTDLEVTYSSSKWEVTAIPGPDGIWNSNDETLTLTRSDHISHHD